MFRLILALKAAEILARVKFRTYVKQYYTRSLTKSDRHRETYKTIIIIIILVIVIIIIIITARVNTRSGPGT